MSLHFNNIIEQILHFLKVRYVSASISPNDDDYICLFILEVGDMLDRQCYRCRIILHIISLSLWLKNSRDMVDSFLKKWNRLSLYLLDYSIRGSLAPSISPGFYGWTG
jgi:hypothetical protein